MAKVTKELQDTLEQHPGIAEVHFTADGHHHFRVFKHGDDLYSRLHEIPEKTKTGIVTKKHVLAPIMNLKGQRDERFLIKESMSRESVLSATPINKPATSGPSKADILASLEVSEEDLKAFLANRKKK